MTIAFVLYPGFTALDIIWPFEVLAFVPGHDAVFVAAEPGPVTEDTGRCQLAASASLDQMTAPDVVVIGGASISGGGGRLPVTGHSGRGDGSLDTYSEGVLRVNRIRARLPAGPDVTIPVADTATASPPGTCRTSSNGSTAAGADAASRGVLAGVGVEGGGAARRAELHGARAGAAVRGGGGGVHGHPAHRVGHWRDAGFAGPARLPGVSIRGCASTWPTGGRGAGW